MKNALLLFAAATFCFASCKREDDAAPAPAYHVEGLKDLTLIKGSLTARATPQLSLNLIYDQAEHERIGLSLENVPAGLYYKMTLSSGIPPFSTVVSFADSGVAEGAYDLKLVMQGALTGRKEAVFSMQVSSIPDCTKEIAGNDYLTTSPCSPGLNYMQNITATAGIKNKVIFGNLDNNGAHITADVDCEGHGLIIPQQVINGITWKGTGGYADSPTQHIIDITVQLTKAGSTVSCNYRLVKPL